MGTNFEVLECGWEHLDIDLSFGLVQDKTSKTIWLIFYKEGREKWQQFLNDL